MEAWFPPAVQPIYRTPVFVSTNREVVQRQTAGAFKDHRLVWQRGGVDSALHRASTGALSFYMLRYGAAVRIEPGPLQSFVLFQMPLVGTADLLVHGQSVAASSSTGAVVSPHLDFALDWHEGCTQLLVKIPRERVEHSCRRLLDDETQEPISFDPAMALDNDAGRSWQHQIASVLCHLNPASGMVAPHGTAAQEEALVHHLLLHQANNYSRRLACPAKAAAPRNVRVAEQFILAHLHEPLTLERIAQASGTSIRGLCLAFQKHLQRSPMAYVRAARLERTHEDLADAAPGTQVTDIALRWGFGHLGRFSTAYRRRYGETPLQTLKARRRLRGGAARQTPT